MPGNERHGEVPGVYKHAHNFPQQFLSRRTAHDGMGDLAGCNVQRPQALHPGTKAYIVHE
jgi:hypothetical protein